MSKFSHDVAEPPPPGLRQYLDVFFENSRAKNETLWFYNAVIMHPKDTDGMANSEDPHQTAPVGAV